MPVERFFIGKELLSNQTVSLDNPQEIHHLLHVTRIGEGESVEIVNGKGVWADATVISISKKQVQLQINQIKTTAKPSFEIVLAQAIPRLNRLDTILEKGTELGMTQLWLFPGERSERKSLSENQMERFRDVTISALKQCGRVFLPEIVYLPPLKEWQPLQYPAFFGDLDEKAPPFKMQRGSEGVIFFIGPESGFTNAEIGKMLQLGAKGVRLHSNILRTDTAAIVALSLIGYNQ